MRNIPKRLIIFLAAFLLALGGGLAAHHIWWQRPAFDPARIAAAETRMWQAYYEQDQVTLMREMIHLMQHTYGLSLMQASAIAESMARAAMAFRAHRRDYETQVLPLLIESYELVRKHTPLDFDVETVARAELDWWVTRRQPGRNTEALVGAKISALYEALLGRPDPAFEQAGLYRARAGRLRDQGGRNADWAEIEALLYRSYEHLTPVWPALH